MEPQHIRKPSPRRVATTSQPRVHRATTRNAAADRCLAFSVDPRFGNTLDAFVLVDLTRTSLEILARCMGREQSRNFFAWHATPHPRVAHPQHPGRRRFARLSANLVT